MTQGAVLSIFDPDRTVVELFQGTPARLRDKSFKLADIALLQIRQAARLLRSTLFFASVGFEGDLATRLHALYNRHEIEGIGIADFSTDADDSASLLARLAAASGVPASARFDCLSVVGGTAGARVLAMVCAGQLRPGFIHCADTSTFDNWTGLKASLFVRHYVSVGDLDGAEILVDAPLLAPPDQRPTIASFDVFDTLIARRCVEPWRVFETVGAKIGVLDFPQQRREAEARVIGGNYRFDDIYDELARHYDWTPERRRDVQAVELSCELDEVIPIAENLARVRDGDLLVSDMYLSESDIRSLLDKAGLKARVGLLVESHGKSSGRVWPIINDQFKITRHLGDNAHADVAMPNQFGLASGLTQASNFNLVERTLLQAGLRDFARLCREARLGTWHDDAGVRALQAIQTSVNFPLLLLASIYLARQAAALGSTSLAFCSRDCNLWLPLFEAVQAKMGLRFETSYFLTSRLARTSGSEAYLHYARDHVRTGALVIDLCGTGWTMANLVERLDRSGCHLFLVDHCPPLDIYERAKATPATCVVHRLFEKRPNANNVILELANMADHGMIVDMREVGSALVPVFAPYPLSPAEALGIKEQRKCFLASVALLENYSLSDVLDLDDASLSFLCASLYEYMSKQTDCFQMFAEGFLKENQEIVRKLVT